MLILGSLPGEVSIQQARYYAHPQNKFWHLLAYALQLPALSSAPYEVQSNLLRKKRIALWDTIASAQRMGSLDSAIRDAEAAPLLKLIEALPNLKTIAFNGKKAAQIGRRTLASCSAYTPLQKITLLDLPSSSPAFAAMPLAKKEQHWQILQEYLSTEPCNTAFGGT